MWPVQFWPDHFWPAHFARLWGAGASHDSPRTPNVHISGSRPSKTPLKFHEKTPKKFVEGKGKKREILGGLAEGGPREGRNHADKKTWSGTRISSRRWSSST